MPKGNGDTEKSVFDTIRTAVVSEELNAERQWRPCHVYDIENVALSGSVKS